MRIESEGTHMGLRWRCVTTDLGHRCGYVEVPIQSPLFGREFSYDETYPNIDVHGGITWTGTFPGKGMSDGFWLGFDCAHAWDNRDPEIAAPKHKRYVGEWNRMNKNGTVKSKEYVETECKKLAEQVVATLPSD